MGGSGVAVGYMLPAPELRPYITTYYLTEVDPGSDIVDQLHPEWGNVRFTLDGRMQASVGPGPLRPTAAFVGVGPTSHATHFRIAPGRYWGIGMLPLGWARFVGVAAADRADRFTDCREDRAFTAFRPLPNLVAACGGDRHAEVEAIDEHMRALLGRPAQGEERILAMHAALVDPAVTSVGEFAQRSGMPLRSLERAARAAFGFTPKLLLRRQRFLRSLAQFMLDPTLAWLDTLDPQYYDQAHFIRDFRRFMGMTPSAYAAMPHPILGAAAHARSAIAGQAMQVLHVPPASSDSAQGLR